MAESAVTELLRFIGEDPERDGLLDTPGRVIRALRELTAGYTEDPAEILQRTFDVTCGELVLLRDIQFTSLCEHHLLPFIGVAHVGYLPDVARGQVVGLSKLARLVHCFARRLQVQERLTQQICDALADHLQPLGVGVVVAARHHCMSCRGVKQQTAEMVTIATSGAMQHDASARREFFDLVNRR